MRKVGMRRVVSAIALMLVAPLALAQTTRVYTYDALGRLVKVTPGTGTPVCYTHDAADNRSVVAAAAGCTAPTGGAGSGGGGGGGNSPPVAINDSYMKTTSTMTWSGTLLVRSNDTDPDLPNDTLTIIAVSGSSYASITAGGGSITITAAPDGDYVLNYTIRDAANATSSATVNLSVISLM
jgi:YD repeat-containing protein